jgi:hypothetical protein
LSQNQCSAALKKPQLWVRLLTLARKQEIIANVE